MLPGRVCATDRPSVLVLQHGHLGPPAILGDWLREHGLSTIVHRADGEAQLPEPDGFAFVASLGWQRSPRDAEDALVRRELELLRSCVERGVPVLGLCFGGQALATVLGGEVKVMSEPELGWHRLETDASELVAEGPWLQWHYESFTTPPGADELARSATGPQAFRAGPHLGVQFHPESTAAIVAQWARKDRDRLPRPLEKYLAELETGSLRHGQQAVEAAHRLFDGFWCGRDYNGGVTCA